VTYLDRLAAQIRDRVPAGTGVPPDADDLFRLYAVLLRAKGASVTDEDVHDAWVAWTTMRGGAEHPAVVPFDELPAGTRDADAPFAEAIRRAAADGCR
jgi:hypothetical protein